MPSSKKIVPSIYGTGFVALDVVEDQIASSESVYSGGTCGNVMAIMAFLGWHSAPIARLKTDYAGMLVREDLEQWGVAVDHLGLEPQAATPIVIEQVYRNRSGQARHRYVWTCPDCSAYLPQFRAVPAKAAEQLYELPAPQVFFFDRVSRSSIDLGRHYAAAGTVVAFEPSASCEPRLFKEAVRLAHIVKYSSQRVRAFSEQLHASKAWLEIETLGEDGLRFKTGKELGGPSGWQHLAAYPVDEVKDTAGCGDWCTSGLLSRIAQNGQRGLLNATEASIRDALQFGQALSAWNCRFTSARGGMYFMSRAAVLSAAEKIIASGVSKRLRVVAKQAKKEEARLFCPTCTDDSREAHLPLKGKVRHAG